MEPHKVNPPLKWWLRWNALEDARANYAARELVERVGLGKVDAATQRRYNALMLELTGKKSNGR